MKHKYRFTAVLLVGILLVSILLTNLYVKTEETGDADKLRVVTSFYPMYIAALNVIGDQSVVELENLSEPQTGCLHDYQMTPADMRLLSGADVFIVNGGGIESFLSDVAEAYPDLTILNASDQVDLLPESEQEHDHDHEADSDEEHSHAADANDEHSDADEYHDEADSDDHMHAHTHSDENAHAWMSIPDYRIQVQTIADGLIKADPAHADVYQKNAAAYDEKLAALEKEAEEVKTYTEGKDLVIFHEAYDYVAADYGMHVIYTLNLDEERQVSAGEVADVVSEIKTHGITTVFAEELYGSDMGNTIERETDAKVCYLDTMVRGEYEADSYLKAMEKNIRMIREAFTP